MQEVNWACCPQVAENPITRAFIEQLVKERKAPSTIENYGRDLNDFLSAFPDIPFSELLEADENQIADYVDWLWKREVKRGNGEATERNKILYTSGSRLAPATIRRRVSTLRSFYRWCIRLRHRRDTINPVREGIRGRERGLVPVSSSVPWIPDERQWKAILRYVLTQCSMTLTGKAIPSRSGLRSQKTMCLGSLCSPILPGFASKSMLKGIAQHSSGTTEATGVVPFFCPTRPGIQVVLLRNGQ